MARKSSESSARWNSKAITPAQSAPTPGMPGNGDSMVLEEDIRRRAYEIYLQRGNTAGSEYDDWLTAEREVRAQAAGLGAHR